MKFLSISAILTALLLTACGEKAEPPAEAATAPEAAAPAPAAEPAKVEPGGYVPTPEEQVKGITRTQEELDKMYEEARANTPLSTIPGEAATAPAATEEAK